MTVQTNTNVASFNGNGVTQIFPIAFKFNNDTDLIVLLIDDATGSASQLTLNSDYTVSGEGDEEGGLINVVVAPAVGQRLKVSRIVDILQLLDLRNQGKFFAEVHEDAFDLLTMIAQQHQAGIDSSIRVSASDPAPARLPAAPVRANKLLSFDENGNPIAVAPSSGDAADLAQLLAGSTGAAAVGTETGDTVEERLTGLDNIVSQLEVGRPEQATIFDYITDQAEREAIIAGTSTVDHSAQFQAAMDQAKTFLLFNGQYSFANPLLIKSDSVQLLGENMKGTRLLYTGSTAGAIQNSAKDTTTRLFCALKDLQLTGPNIGGNILLDWKSMQFGELHKLWLMGQAEIGCTLLNLAAEWAVTECTYNTISNCYAGLMHIGISISDGANNNTIRESRLQPGLSGGIGIYMEGSAPGRVSSNTIRDNGFEYPGAISTGINVYQNTDGTRIIGNRFEQLANGIVVGGTSNKNVYAPRSENYFESCTNKINLSAGGTGTTMRTIAAITGNGISSWATVGSAYNINCVRSAAGQYDFTFINGSLIDSGYIVKPASVTDQVLITSKTSTGFRVLTRNSSGTNIDTALLDVSVEYNK